MAEFEHGLGRRSEDVLLALRGEIERGIFAPASKLPTEHELCARFGVSRTTVRRAIARLKEANLITVRRRAGMFVCQPPMDSIEARTIGVMGQHEEPFLLQAQTFALDHGCRLDVFYADETAWNPRRERLFLKRVQDARYRALVALCTPFEPGNADLLRELAAQQTRVIHVEYYAESLPEQEYILPDHRKAGYTGAVELQLAGYKQFCYLGFSQQESPWARLVEAGFAEALSLHADGYSRETTFFDFPRSWGGEAQAASQDRLDRWIEGLSPQTGLLCRNPAMAERLILALGHHGRHVPEDIGIVTVDAIGETPVTPIHTLVFDRAAIKMQALKTAVENGPILHELVTPKIRRGDTIQRRAQREPTAPIVPASPHVPE